MLNDPTATVYDSAAIEQLVAASTSELAPVLDAARKIWRVAPIVLALALSVLVLAAIYNWQPGIVGAFVFGIVAWPLSALLDRRRRTVRLEYNLKDSEIRSFNGLISAFNEFANSQRVWRVPVKMDQRDRKRNAGAAFLVQREKISPHLALPSLIESNLKFPTLRVGKETIYLAPDALLVVAKNSVAALRYDEVEIDARLTRFVEHEGVPSDSQVVEETWQFVNKKGGPDRRFANNRKLPVCVYGEIDFRSKSGLNERIQCSRAERAAQLASSVIAMRHSTNIEQSIKNAMAQALDLQNNEKLDLATAFERESERARTLALKRGELWEFLLIEELLKSKLKAIRGEYEAFEKSLPRIPKKQVNASHFLNWLGAEFERLSNVPRQMDKCLNEEIPSSLGPPGVSGDPLKMLRAVDVLFVCCRSFLAFEQELSVADPPPKLKVFSATLRGITLAVICVVEELANQWSQKVDGLRNGSKEFQINLKFPSLPQINIAMVEMGKVRQHPDSYL